MSVTDTSLTPFPPSNVSSTSYFTGTSTRVDIFAELPPLHLSVSINWFVFYIVVYGIIFFGSVIGNQLVIWSYAIEPKLRRPTNTFIVSLAVADLITGLIGLPPAIFGRLFKGPYVCFAATRPFLYVVTFMMCSVSIDHLLLITIDRYIAVTRPLRYPTIMTTRRCRMAVGLVWLIGGFFGTIPVLSWPSNPALWVCGITKYEESTVSVHRLASVGFIPVFLSILCLFYIRIYAVVKIHVKKKRERIKTQIQTDDASRTSMTRTTVTTALVLAAFAICWLPTTAKFALEIYATTTEEETFLYHTIAEVLSFGNSMVNPIIYGYRNDLFRSTYKRIIRSACLRRRFERETNVRMQKQSTSASATTISTMA